MKSIKSPQIIVILTAIISLATPAWADQEARRLDHVNTKFAANLALWWGGNKVPTIDKLEKAHALGFEAVEFWAYQRQDIEGIAARAEELGLLSHAAKRGRFDSLFERRF